MDAGGFYDHLLHRLLQLCAARKVPYLWGGSAMTVADIAMLAFTACNSVRVFAYAPQIAAIACDKSGARAISCTTWGLFAVSHLSTVGYAVLIAVDQRMAMIFAANAACCAAIVVLTLFKRRAVARQSRRNETASTEDVMLGMSSGTKIEAPKDLDAACGNKNAKTLQSRPAAASTGGVLDTRHSDGGPVSNDLIVSVIDEHAAMVFALRVREVRRQGRRRSSDIDASSAESTVTVRRDAPASDMRASFSNELSGAVMRLC